MRAKQYFMGVDPSITNTGMVLMSGKGEVLLCLNSKLREKVTGVDSDDILRLKSIADYITQSVKASIDKDRAGADYEVHAGYETYSINSINRPYTTGELGGVLKLALMLAGFALHLVEPARLKLFATGHGGASKDAMLAQALIEFPAMLELDEKEQTNDISDAYFLAKWAWYYAAQPLVLQHETYRNHLRRRLELCQKHKKNTVQLGKSQGQRISIQRQRRPSPPRVHL